MNRKDFIRNLGLLTAGGTLFGERTFANPNPSDKAKLLKKIGVQLFSVPVSLERDFKGTIALLSEMGYKELEMFGPYPYSATSAKEGWNAITHQLGFSGSGYFGYSEEDVSTIFKEHGFTVPAVHTDLDTLEHKMESLGKASNTIGFEYVVLPFIPEERRRSLDDYKTMAEVFNKIGRQAKEQGLKFVYHNHGYGLSEVNGQVPLHIILDNTDPDLVFFEMDLFWTVAGRADPIKYLEKYSGRYRAMHLKDMKEKKTFSGDGGSPGQWMELFPNMTSAGNGALDLEPILRTAVKHKVEHFFVEQDMVKDPEIALKKSIDYLTSI